MFDATIAVIANGTHHDPKNEDVSQRKTLCRCMEDTRRLFSGLFFAVILRLSMLRSVIADMDEFSLTNRIGYTSMRSPRRLAAIETTTKTCRAAAVPQRNSLGSGA